MRSTRTRLDRLETYQRRWPTKPLREWTDEELEEALADMADLPLPKRWPQKPIRDWTDQELERVARGEGLL